MVIQYKKIGVTTGGYRGERAVLQERVIEGLEQPSFIDSILRLTDVTPQTIYLNNNNTSEGYSIILPNSQSLWNNWKITIINESSNAVNVYYYTDDLTQLNLFKEITSGNMSTLILLDNTTIAGTWTTLRTAEQSSVDLLAKYTSDVYDQIEVTFNELQQDTTTIVRQLSTILAGTAIKSIYVKTVEQFTIDSESDSDETFSLKLSIGTGINESDEEYDEDHFISNYDMTQAVSDTNFTKDLFDEILSTNSDKIISATFTGTNLDKLVTGKLLIVVEKAKTIDPTILKNPILQTQLPIGVIMNYIFKDDTGSGYDHGPDGFWRLDGSMMPNAASAIPEFVEKLNKTNNQLVNKIIIPASQWHQIDTTYGSCGKFCWEGSALRFPKINHFVQGLTDLASLGNITEAGLPNITGHAGNWALPCFSGGLYDGGSIKMTNYGGSVRFYAGTQYNAIVGMDFDASLSSTVYGKSNTVQPQSVRYPYIISIYNTFQNQASIDLQAILENSTDKANITLNNLSDEGKKFAALLGMPSTTSLDIALAASTTTYTAPSTGWIYISGTQYSYSGYVFLENVSTGLTMVCQPPNVNSFEIRAFIPVIKGQTFKVTYADCYIYVFKFIYAEGSKSEAS